MESVSILVVNAGSSSIKVGLFFVDGPNLPYRSVVSATVTGLGLESAELAIKYDGQEKTTRPISSDYISAINELFTWLLSEQEAQHISAVGHRFVHGGMTYGGPVEIDQTVLDTIGELADDDPEHTPQALQCVRVLQERLPDARQFASFDTAFFHDIPAVAQIVPIPRRYRELGVRRYGFHGLSYQYLQKRFGELAGDTAVHGRVIYAHLGSGASLAATLDGKPIDMTMGLTPASGVVMSSRPGDLDPGLAFYLQRKADLSLEDFQTMVNHESGLKGVSGTSADMYELITAEKNDPQAAEAVELFVYRVRQAIGSLAASLGGLDSLVFSGGIGEQSSVLRKRICDGLAFLGITIDDNRNDRHDELLSVQGGQVGVHMIYTNEADTIIQQTTQLFYKTTDER